MTAARILIALFFVLLPSYAYANGGGPILLYINVTAFVVGQVWILSAETYMYCKSLKLKPSIAFIQVFKVNLVSTLAVGLGLPFILAIITGFAMNLPEPIGGIMSILGTWAYSSAPYMEYLLYITTSWFIITLYLTVICERWFIQKLWAKSGFISPVDVNSFMWKVHLVSYTGLIIAFVIFILISNS